MMPYYQKKKMKKFSTILIKRDIKTHLTFIAFCYAIVDAPITGGPKSL